MPFRKNNVAYTALKVFPIFINNTFRGSLHIAYLTLVPLADAALILYQ